MQTETLEKTTAEIAPINETAELIDREIHRKTLEQINVLAREYEIRNPSAVAKFLSRNKSLIDLLEEIPVRLREHFGEQQNLVLRFFLDPEDPTAHCLHVRVPTKLETRAARELLEKFDEQWWNENEINSNFKIFVNLDFVK
jgi:hypothetical protein